MQETTYLCTSCHKRPIFIMKRGLCIRCYHALRSQNGPFLEDKKFVESPTTVKEVEKDGEINFVKNFFSHNEWVFQPAKFRLKGESYTPDFYDARRNVFIEVARTRQRYQQAKDKWAAFQKRFPGLVLEIRVPTGELLSELTYGKKWEFQKETTEHCT